MLGFMETTISVPAATVARVDAAAERLGDA
jgi:hypothetical protein